MMHSRFAYAYAAYIVSKDLTQPYGIFYPYHPKGHRFVHVALEFNGPLTLVED
jgi:hypothetical protein